MAFVIPRLKQGKSSIFWRKIIKRTVLIFGIGLFLNWFPFFEWKDNILSFKHWLSDDLNGIRIMGVLQRIALSYFFASVICYFFKEKRVLFISFVLLIVYWLMTKFLGGEMSYSIEGFFGNKVDEFIIGKAHLYKGESIIFDPEGLVGTISSTAQILLGYLTGKLITNQGEVSWLFPNLPKAKEPHYKLLSILFVSATILLIIAYIWQLDFPIIKKIWSSSYVLHTTGLAIFMIGVMIWFIEVLKKKNFITKFFDVFGKNPLFIFVLSGLIPRFMNLIRIENTTNDGYISPLKWFYINIIQPIFGTEELGSFAYAVCFLILMWSIAFWLDKKKIYIKV